MLWMDCCVMLKLARRTLRKQKTQRNGWALSKSPHLELNDLIRVTYIYNFARR